MPKDSRQDINIPAVRKKLYRKSMTENVRRKPYPAYITGLPEFGKISLQIPGGDLCVVFSAKDVIPLCENGAIYITEQDFTKLRRKGYKTLFSSLTLHPKHEIVKVHILFKKANSFVNSQTAVQHTQGDDMRPPQILPFWLKVKKAVNVSRRKRG